MQHVSSILCDIYIYIIEIFEEVHIVLAVRCQFLFTIYEFASLCLLSRSTANKATPGSIKHKYTFHIRRKPDLIIRGFHFEMVIWVTAIIHEVPEYWR